MNKKLRLILPTLVISSVLLVGCSDSNKKIVLDENGNVVENSAESQLSQLLIDSKNNEGLIDVDEEIDEKELTELQLLTNVIGIDVTTALNKDEIVSIGKQTLDVGKETDFGNVQDTFMVGIESTKMLDNNILEINLKVSSTVKEDVYLYLGSFLGYDNVGNDLIRHSLEGAENKLDYEFKNGDKEVATMYLDLNNAEDLSNVYLSFKPTFNTMEVMSTDVLWKLQVK